jgi:2-keto-3-deoxy-L-rhamnonate aldolase RhmA
VSSIKPVLDMGADGIITPQVKSADEVRQVVQHCRYKPIGDRGHGPRRASDYGNYGGGVEYAAAANDGVFVVVQIERADALADLDNILAVDGYDSLAIGPSDLAASMGHTGNYNHPEVQKALETIIRKSLAAGKFIGSGMGPEAQFAQHLFDLGAQWIQCGDDFSYMMKYCAQLYSSIRNFDR